MAAIGGEFFWSAHARFRTTRARLA